MLTRLASLVPGVLPYVEVHEWRIPFPLIDYIPIRPFGVLVVIGILVGAQVAGMRAKQVGIDKEKFSSLVFWTVASGIVLSHVLDTLFYYPRVVIERPWELLLIHRGLSSFGGFFGATVGFFAYARKHKLPIWRSADAIAYGLPFGWFFGRMGCSVVHDHPGRYSDSVLAVAFPDGARFDLGLLELMLTPVLIAAVVLVGRRTKRPGAIITTLALVYPFIRFPLDFLRAPVWDGGDIRYFGLTPGHYASLILLALGVFLWHRSRQATGPAALEARREGAAGKRAASKI